VQRKPLNGNSTVYRYGDEAGFSQIKECTVRQGALPEVEIMELREDSWFVEGIRS
jgi:hypothetical protein